MLKILTKYSKNAKLSRLSQNAVNVFLRDSALYNEKNIDKLSTFS